MQTSETSENVSLREDQARCLAEIYTRLKIIYYRENVNERSCDDEI